MFYGYAYEIYSGGEKGTTNIGRIVSDLVWIYYQTRAIELYSHPAWWKLKEYMFHFIMVPAYLANLCIHLIRRSLLPLIGASLTPLLPLLKVTAYTIGITMGLVGELNQELLHYTLRSRFYKIESKPPWRPIIRIIGMNEYATPPLPHRYMVLSGVQLWQWFVGWWQKIMGCIPTFTARLHKMGIHKVFLVTIILLQCLTTTTGAIQSTKYTVLDRYEG